MTELLCTIKPYDFLAWAFILSAVIIFWKWHLNQNNHFNVMDLVCEDGKLSSSKFMRTGSWAVMSYGFYLLAKQSPENLVGYAPLYGGIWVSARALDKWQQTNNVNLSSTHTETYSESHSTEEKVLTNITLTPEQKEQLKQACYSAE
jgi:hypothetical protein